MTLGRRHFPPLLGIAERRISMYNMSPHMATGFLCSKFQFPGWNEDEFVHPNIRLQYYVQWVSGVTLGSTPYHYC